MQEEVDDETTQKNNIVYILMVIGCVMICFVFVIIILCVYKRIQSDKKAVKQEQAAIEDKILNEKQEKKQKVEIVKISNSDDMKADDKEQIARNVLGEGSHTRFGIKQRKETAGTASRETADDATEVRVWLGEIVGLSQYVNEFLLNGYDSLDMIKEINEDDQLKEIEIYDKDHRNKILREIGKLNGIEEGVNPKGEGTKEHIQIQ